MKLVFDTSVLFAAFVARKGLCASVVEHAIAEETVFLSRYILDELGRALLGKTKVSEKLHDDYIRLLEQASSLVTPGPVDPSACRDPDDAAILGTALAADADALVSGDKDLWIIHHFGKVRILTPRQYYDHLTIPPI